MIGGFGGDTIVGDGGADSLVGGIVSIDSALILGATNGVDLADDIQGGAGADTLSGGNGDDVLGGGGGDDSMLGGDGDDVMLGSDGQDQLFGGDGADNLEGGNGVDELVGQLGNDTFNGGGGADVILREEDEQIVAPDAADSVVLGGCTDSSATNYNPSAAADDGTCSYSGSTGNPLDDSSSSSFTETVGFYAIVAVCVVGAFAGAIFVTLKGKRKSAPAAQDPDNIPGTTNGKIEL